ncbi:hypothetical protein G9A89_005931 [Geosiphon pyriformis]|nr:hypothetical protein G9A89_005931 [Geosiphon pyriformis]
MGCALLFHSVLDLRIEFLEISILGNILPIVPEVHLPNIGFTEKDMPPKKAKTSKKVTATKENVKSAPKDKEVTDAQETKVTPDIIINESQDIETSSKSGVTAKAKKPAKPRAPRKLKDSGPKQVKTKQNKGETNKTKRGQNLNPQKQSKKEETTSDSESDWEDHGLPLVKIRDIPIIQKPEDITSPKIISSSSKVIALPQNNDNSDIINVNGKRRANSPTQNDQTVQISDETGDKKTPQSPKKARINRRQPRNTTVSVETPDIVNRKKRKVTPPPETKDLDEVQTDDSLRSLKKTRIKRPNLNAISAEEIQTQLQEITQAKDAHIKSLENQLGNLRLELNQFHIASKKKESQLIQLQKAESREKELEELNSRLKAQSDSKTKECERQVVSLQEKVKQLQKELDYETRQSQNLIKQHKGQFSSNSQNSDPSPEIRLYEDLTGVTVLDLKIESKRKIFDCIHTGSGEGEDLHFKLILNDDGRWEYSPDLQMPRDRFLLAILDEHLQEELEFSSDQSQAFFWRLLNSLQGRSVGLHTEEDRPDYIPPFVAMKPVGFAAGGSGSVSAGLGTRSGVKNKHSVGLHSRGASYKKPKKPVVVDSEVNSEVDSVSGVSDLDNVENVIAEKTCYAESDVSGLDNDINNVMPKKTRTRTYVLNSKLPPLFFNVPSDSENTLPLPSPKFHGFNRFPPIGSRAPEKRNFNLSKLFALDIELSAVPDKTNNDKIISLKKNFYCIDGFGRVLTPSKFPGIIRSSFTSEISLNKARKLAISEKILVNNNLRKSSVHSDWEVIVKEIPVDLLKLAIEAVFSKFGKIILIKVQLIGLWQKALVEYELSEMADLVAAR